MFRESRNGKKNILQGVGFSDSEGSNRMMGVGDGDGGTDQIV